ncbi:MAG: agmatinase family protein [Planctomycetota bacterium]
MTFDPNAPSVRGSDIFGLPIEPGQARIHLLPIPFDATVTYRAGAADGPSIINTASTQVDLLDHQFGAVWTHGIHLLDEDPNIRALSEQTRSRLAPIIERGDALTSHPDVVRTVTDAGQRIDASVHRHVRALLLRDRIPGVLGGEHAVSLGAIRACAAHVDRLGILQLDAHMDLHAAFGGVPHSHASVMHNALEACDNITRLVQVGIRDYAEDERDTACAQPQRITTHFDMDWWRALDAGATFTDLCARAIEPLPADVYVTFDIDALDPSLCPGTGTPVPGGLTFNQASVLLESLARSGRRIVGFDLVEVAPGNDADWNGAVGARILYKLCGCALGTT